MPIVINELVVKATVEAAAPVPQQGAARPGTSAEEREALVATIVEEVLRVLDRAKER